MVTPLLVSSTVEEDPPATSPEETKIPPLECGVEAVNSTAAQMLVDGRKKEVPREPDLLLIAIELMVWELIKAGATVIGVVKTKARIREVIGSPEIIVIGEATPEEVVTETTPEDMSVTMTETTRKIMSQETNREDGQERKKLLMPEDMATVARKTLGVT